MEAYSQSIVAVDEVFRRLAFGHDGGDTPNTSTAVACGLILNYLDRAIDDRVLPDILKAELLRGSAFDAKRYPQATYLHKYLLRHCRLTPGPLGRWGKGVVQRFKHFWKTRPWGRVVLVRSGFGGYGAQKAWGLIKTEIDSNRPVMATTTYQRLKSKGEPYYTVVVCGYRVTSSGKREILIHP
ncbi:MAG: hypothetical protein LBL27_01095, partial [Coriobacteriales bacterium]|nr:hypothetical protein [Coriobacteriales bacterium]